MAGLTRTILVRHGEVDRAWRGRIYGGRDVPLSPRGLRQSRAIARALAPTATGPVVTSGLDRTETIGRLLAPEAGTALREPALAEIDRGTWAGLTWDELNGGGEGAAWRAWWSTGGRTRPPDGESLEDLSRRVIPVVRTLVRRHAGQTLTLVAHSWVHRILVAHALGLPPAGSFRFQLPTAGVALLEWDGPGLAMLAGFRPGILPGLS